MIIAIAGAPPPPAPAGCLITAVCLEQTPYEITTLHFAWSLAGSSPPFGDSQGETGSGLTASLGVGEQ